MPGDLTTERWAGGADGVVITTTNSSIDGENGEQTFELTDIPPDGSVGWMKVMQNALNNVRWDRTTTHNVIYLGLIHYPSHLPSTTTHVIVNTQNTTTVRAQIRMSTDGGYTVRNGTSITGDPTGPIPAATKRRLHLTQNWAAGTQKLEVWFGNNLWGTTPDYTVNGVLTNATRNRLVVGVIAGPSTTTGAYHLFGRVDLSTTGFEPPLVAAGFPENVVVNGAKKTIVSRSVVINGVKKNIANMWVVVNGVKKPLV